MYAMCVCVCVCERERERRERERERERKRERERGDERTWICVLALRGGNVLGKLSSLWYYCDINA